MNLINLASWTWLFETINSLLLVVCNWIYSLIGVLYQVFEAIAKVNLFDRETFSEITSRIYIIMGVAMLFIFAYNIILMIINPEDKKTTGNTGKVVKETIISLVLVILLPTIFNYMYIFQNHILESNIIGQIILGTTGSTSTSSCQPNDYDCTCDFKGYGLDKYQENHWFWPTANTSEDEAAILKYYCDEYKNKPAAVRGAYSVAPTVLSAFYSPANFSFAQCVSYLQGETSLITDSDDQQICINYFYDVTASKYTGNIKPFVYDTYLKNIASDSNKTNIEFNGIMAVVAGCLAVWMFLCYAMEIGVRVAKLGVLQIISPIAVMMRIIPKQKEAMFDKWLKHLINTYLDVFIRLLIIYFALFAISLVEGVLDNLFASLGTVQGSNGVATFGIRSLAAVIVILGILKFAQQAPDLLKEFFGSGGSFALKSPGKQLSENKLGGSALGMAGAGLSSLAGNLWNAGKNLKNAQGLKNKAKALGKAPFSAAGGLFGGAVRGAKYGYGANGFKDLGHKIAEAKYATDAAQERGLLGGIKYRSKKIGESFADFGQFITGEGATNFRLKAIEASLGDVQGVNATFKTGNIESIEAAFNKMSEEHKNEKDVKFGGREYTYTPNGWVDKNNPNSTPIEHNELGKMIKAHFDEMKKTAYVSEFAKNEQAYERITSKMINTLNENFPKIGQDIIEGINKGLGETIDANGIRFNNTDEITDKISDLMKKISASNSNSEKEGYRKQIYDINDVLEKNLKNVKKNEVIAQQEKKDK